MALAAQTVNKEIILNLLEAEEAERKVRSIRYRLSLAKFPVDKNLDSFDFSVSPVRCRSGRSMTAAS